MDYEIVQAGEDKIVIKNCRFVKKEEDAIVLKEPPIDAPATYEEIDVALGKLRDKAQGLRGRLYKIDNASRRLADLYVDLKYKRDGE